MGIGDDVMLTGQVRVAQEADPQHRRVRIQYEKRRWVNVWDHNPRIARDDEAGDFLILRARDGYKRPYIEDKGAECWTWKAWGPPRGEIYFTEDEKDYARKHAGRIVFEPRIKAGASPNKDWGAARWKELLDLAARKGLTLTQLGTSPRVLPGAEFVMTPTMRHAAAILSSARAAVLPEGGLHHVAAAVRCPAVVIFGGFISPAVTGYAEQTSLFTGTGLGCGMRVPCPHCARAMKDITPQQVLRALEARLEEHRRSVAA